MKVDAEWFYCIASSWPCRSFTEQDSELIIRYTQSAVIAVCQSAPIEADLIEHSF